MVVKFRVVLEDVVATGAKMAATDMPDEIIRRQLIRSRTIKHL